MATRKKANKKTKRKSSRPLLRKRGKKSVKRARRSATSTRRRAAAKKPQASSSPEIFEALAAILAPYAHLFEAEMEPRMGYCLKTYGEWPSEIYFAGVQWTEAGVFFHLFPLLRHPQLLDGIGAELRGRMEGKLSFRFEALEPELFEELAAATKTAFECLRGEGLLRVVA